MSIDECLYHAVQATGGKRVHIGVWQDENGRWGCSLTLQVFPFTEISVAQETADEACSLCLEHFRPLLQQSAD